MSSVKSVAVIGCGPAGAITIDALVQENAFEKIKVYERREKPGGCWVPDPLDHKQQLPNFETLGNRTPDPPVKIPDDLPSWKPRCQQYRFSDTSIYPLLETNIAAEAMEFSQEPIPEKRSGWSIQRHGCDTPFRHHAIVQQWIEGLVERRGYEDLIEFSTTVERVTKTKDNYSLILRKEVGDRDYWWEEHYDAVIVASGHYSVPFIPHVEGLAEFARAYPGSVEHTKSFRDPEKYKAKRVVTVGASISGPDVAAFLASVVEHPLHSVVRGKYHPYFGDWAFRNPHIVRHPPISHIDPKTRTVHLEDGTTIPKVDHIIFGTGYSWTMHFLPQIPIRNNRLPNLYQHIFYNFDSHILFVGAVAAGFTFKVFEWQAVAAARYLAGRVSLPGLKERQRWEQERIAEKGDSVPFTALYPKFEEYFEEMRALAGEPGPLGGRPLPRFEKKWRENFDAAHLKRIRMWQDLNRKAEEEMDKERISSG